MPQVLAWVYFSLLSLQVYSINMGGMPGTRIFTILYQFIPFFVTLICLSSFGYLLNDYCDIESDARAGKRNLLARLPRPLSLSLILILLFISIEGWLRQYGSTAFTNQLVASILFLFQLALLIAYSLKPLRLKERGMAGVIADALYGDVNPALLTIFTLHHLQIFTREGDYYRFMLLITIIALWFVKGVRNILLHQLDDRKRDRRAGTKTFVAQHSALGTLNFINKMLPVEGALMLIFVLLVSYVIPPFFISLVIFAIVNYLKFSGWKLAYQPRRQLKFKFLYFMNDYYERWFPVCLLLIFSVYNHWAIILLLIHLILFPSFTIHLWKEMKTIQENFKTEEDY